MKNEHSLDTLCAALAYAMGIDAPEHAAAASEGLCEYVDKAFGGRKADRILMYNPDAIAQWIYEKYPQLMKAATAKVEIEVPFCTVMPSVTPVCFGTMYTGAQPCVHGIQKYEKPVIKIDTLFDALIRAGKKPVIISTRKCSMGNIYLERDMDYILPKTMSEVNAAAARVIMEDKHDFVLVYNGNYDYRMHRVGCEGMEALAELRCNSRSFDTLLELVKEHWQGHNTLVGFAMDHGCHDIEPFVAKKDGQLRRGSHGQDIDEDLNVLHRYQIIPAK